MFRLCDINVDHIIPKSKGGSNKLSNLQLVHIKCNELKADAYDVSTKVQLEIRHEKGDRVGLQGPTFDDNRMGGAGRDEAGQLQKSAQTRFHVRTGPIIREVSESRPAQKSQAEGLVLSVAKNSD